MQNTIEVRLNVRQREGYLSANCPDVPGLHVRGETPEAVRTVAMRAVEDLFQRNAGARVKVTPTDDLAVLRVRFV